MRLIRYIHPPSGRVTIEEKSILFSPQKIITEKADGNRIEIYNIQGDLVRVITDRNNIKLLKLQKGFYLLREKDITGRVISSSKLIF